MKQTQSYLLFVGGQPLVYEMGRPTRDFLAVALKREPETLEAEHLIHEELQLLADRLGAIPTEQAREAIDEQVLFTIADRHLGRAYAHWAQAKVA